MSIPQDVQVGWLGGSVPVQGEGRIEGKPFYFRARGAAWSLSIGGRDPVADAEWRNWEPWGTWPEAGYMELPEAERLLREGAAMYASGRKPGTDRPNLPEPFDLDEQSIAAMFDIPRQQVRELARGGGLEHHIWQGQVWTCRSFAEELMESRLAGKWPWPRSP